MTLTDLNKAIEVIRHDKLPAGSGRKRRSFDMKHIEWLYDHSAKYTAKECSDILGYRVDTIRRKCTGLNLRLKAVRGKKIEIL